ncbi:hypothetical protein DO021_00115 [Desulfobacter hydrogenophilus]|uniref:Transposase IS200-like domain-containing protein n=1 Tax=Desulfobacter hydrogenophilus TaxID=2291 RepID=A0A328FJ85_9BACT|nr:hypothetical protein DO021_00115 [Desulfobacter hydrogenophilus]
MPNHIHGIVQLVGAPLAGARVPNAVSRNNYHYDGFRATMDNDRATARVAPTVGNIIGAYKSLCVQNCLHVYSALNIVVTFRLIRESDMETHWIASHPLKAGPNL